MTITAANLNPIHASGSVDVIHEDGVPTVDKLMDWAFHGPGSNLTRSRQFEAVARAAMDWVLVGLVQYPPSGYNPWTPENDAYDYGYMMGHKWAVAVVPADWFEQ